MDLFLKPLNGLLFKAFGWASIEGLWMGFFLRPLDGLLFEMGCSSSWASFRDYFSKLNLRGGLF